MPDVGPLDPRDTEREALKRQMLEAPEEELPKIPDAPEVDGKPAEDGPRLRITEFGEQGQPVAPALGGEGGQDSLILRQILTELEEMHASIREGFFLEG